LLARAFSNALFAASANRAGLTAMAEIQRAVTATEEGQSLDLLSSHCGPVAATAAQYHRIVLKKSAAYSTVLPLRLGAALAGIAEPNILLRLTRFAMFAGIAFQIQDDLRSFGSSGANGKNPADDLREGKTTLPAVAFSETATRDDRMLLETFAATNRKERSHQQAQLLASRMVASGALDRARRVAYVAAAHAKHEWATMERVMLPGVGRDALAALPEFAITHR
jgi:geranylgeranyl pyrophosphate synthase